MSLYQHYAKVVESLEEKSERNITTQEYCTQIQLLNILSSATAQPHTLDKKMKMHYSKSAVPDRYYHFFFSMTAYGTFGKNSKAICKLLQEFTTDKEHQVSMNNNCRKNQMLFTKKMKIHCLTSYKRQYLIPS